MTEEKTIKRAWCDDCGHDYFVARGLLGSCDANWCRRHAPIGTATLVCLHRIRRSEVLPLLCPKCGGQMRLIAFVTEGTQIRKILDHIGVDSEPPHISPARGPPLWEDCGAQTDAGVHIEPDWGMAAQPAPDYEVDQRINW